MFRIQTKIQKSKRKDSQISAQHRNKYIKNINKSPHKSFIIGGLGYDRIQAVSRGYPRRIGAFLRKKETRNG